MFLLFACQRPCQRSQNLSQQALSSLYSSPSPVPAHLKSICRSMPLCNLLRHWIPAAGSLTSRQCRTKIYPKAVIGRSPSGLGVGGLGSTLSLRVLLAPPPNRNFDELFLWPNFPDPESLHSPHPAHSCGFHNTVAAWLKQSSPDRSITNLHSQQSVTDSMPTKPLAIHYCEAVQGEACPTAAC